LCDLTGAGAGTRGEARRLGRVGAQNRTLGALRADEGEALDHLEVARHRVAAEVLADAQAHRERAAGDGMEGRGNDPEVVGGGGRGAHQAGRQAEGEAGEGARGTMSAEEAHGRVSLRSGVSAGERWAERSRAPPTGRLTDSPRWARWASPGWDP